MHEISFSEFPCLLREWLKRQDDVNSIVLLVLEIIVWDQTKLDRVKVLYDKCSWDIDFWLSQVKEWYIVEIVIEYRDYFNETERKFE